MSEEANASHLVHLTRELIEAQGVDATIRFYGPDSVFDLSDLGAGVFAGHAAIRGFHVDWLAPYEEAKDEPEEVIDVGNGVVFAVVRGNARPDGSPRHVRVHDRTGVVAIWDDELVVRVVIYRDVAEARAAAERLAEERG
jgi:hypothetical protein